MDIILLVVLGFIGIKGVLKGHIQVSKKKELRGTKARILSVIFILSGISLVLRTYVGFDSVGTLIAIAFVVALATIVFMILGQEDIVNTEQV